MAHGAAAVVTFRLVGVHAGGSIRVAVVALAGLALIAPAAASAARPLRTAVVTKPQAEALRGKAIRVRVVSPSAQRVRLFVVSSGVVATRVRAYRVQARHARVVKLRLGRAGLRRLRRCGRFKVTVSAAAAGTPETGPGTPVRSSRRLKPDRHPCRRTPGSRGGGGSNGGGSPGSPGQPVDYQTPADADRCDWLDSAVCLQPWPNNYFTTRDSTTDTGERLNLNLLSMPRNKAGKPIDPTDWNRGDGFSPGVPLVTRISGLDNKQAFERSHLVPITDMAQAFAPRQPVVVINTRTEARQLVWAEIDSNPQDPQNVNLIIRPGKNFQENTRYVVALRDLRDASGNPLGATQAFRIYRDGILTTNKTVEARRPRFESDFRTLAEAGIDRDSLYLAWDFTTGSEKNLSERMLAIRNDAFKQLGDTNLSDLTVQGHAPAFQVTKVTDNPNDKLARIVDGKITVPCYLDLPNCASGSRFLFDTGSTNGPPILQPIPGNTVDATFRCIIPKSAANGGARPSLYGHGLFGSRDEVMQGQLQDMASEHNFVFCATEWIGMACADIPDPTNPASIPGDTLAGNPPQAPDCDIPNVATILTDLSNFPTLADRVQQGMLDFMYLGRAMFAPGGLASDPAFQLHGHPVIDTRRLFYDGNSQGGIIGGALIAVEPDLDRGVIGVPGMNYSTLLTRSTDFGTGAPPSSPNDISYAYPLYTSYPNEIERPLIFALMQQLWDRAEADGYAEHMTSDPYPNTPAHKVLMQGALGDHQVAQVAAETEARTIAAWTHDPYADPGRDYDVYPGYGLPRISTYPFEGSAYTLFDSGPPRIENGSITGTNPPPTTNTPPPAEGQEDPHELPRRTVTGRRQKDAFLRIGGVVIDVCGSRPCYSGSWNGP